MMYSGGLDSLGTLYHLLTDPLYKDYKIHVHHVHQHNVERRAKAESIAVNIALKELNDLGFKFDYSESSITTPNFGPYFMYDTDSINFFAGYVCSVNPNIELVAMGMNAGDSNHSLEDRRKRANAILTAFTPAEKIYPVLNLSKREIYDSLPESLKNKFWSCRTPIYTEKEINPCGRCKTCLQLKEAGIR